ncbi:MAG: class I SAM-dependent methyltransferase [Candidatus Sumerlaeia bacterium]|nr:class I SAM-dependent methyltransferase [Candidatus Sumerlaeia bacterium]
MESTSLYAHADLYDAVFGRVEPAEVDFLAGLLAGATHGGRRVLSLGCGTGRLEAALAARGVRWVGLDLSPAMLRVARRRDPAGHAVAARMESMPFAGAEFAGALAGLLSFSYVVGGQARRDTVRRLGDLLLPEAPVILEVPMAWRPRALQGVSERLEGAAGFEFRYLDLASEDDAGAVLHTRLRVWSEGRTAERYAPLTVFTPGGIRELLTREGLFANVQFFAPWESASATDTPPPDCLRAVVVARRTA